MNTNRMRKWTVGLVAALIWVPLSASADTVLHGRISYDAGGTLLKGTEESDWSSGSVNTLVLPGDTVWVDNGGSTELEFSGGSFLRMADGSKAEVAGMPPSATIRGWIGSFYVQRLARSSGDFIFYTPAGIVEVEKDSAVRIDIVSEGITTVSTRWGRATVRTDAGGSVLAHSGRRVFIEAGLLPSQPTPYDRTNEDAFDRWNRERAEFLATGGNQTPSSVQISQDVIGASDLDRYGEWVYIDNRPCWRPTVVVDYTPYHHGYWNSVHNVGNVWVGNYPFSYVTSHHGYWDHHARYGWVWSYAPQWSPARCATIRYGDYFVWAPVNRHYRPVYPTTSAYFSIGGVSFGYFGTSFVHADYLYRGPHYVNFAHHNTFRNYYGHGNHTVNIWNINYNSPRPSIRVPYNNSVTTVRDYTPRRSIRGASTFTVAGRSASERAQRLESSSGRAAFSRATRTGGEFTRTAAVRSASSDRIRTARIDQGTPDFARATRNNPVRATNERSLGRDSAAINTPREGRSVRGATTSRDASATRSTSDRTPTRSSASRDTGGRTNSSRQPSRSSSTPQRTDIDPRSGSSFDGPTRITTYSRTPARTSERASTSSRTPSRETSATPRTSNRGSSDAGRTPSAATSERTPARTTSPRMSEPASRTRTQAPATANRQSSTPSRSYQAPRGNAPTRTVTPNRSVTSRQQSTTAPSRSVAPRQSAPSRSVAPRQSVPSRSVAPRQSAPSRSVSSSRSVTPRQSAPSRSVSTPTSRQSSVRSPAPSSSRSSASSRSVSRDSSASARTPSTARGNSRGR